MRLTRDLIINAEIAEIAEKTEWATEPQRSTRMPSSASLWLVFAAIFAISAFNRRLVVLR